MDNLQQEIAKACKKLRLSSNLAEQAVTLDGETHQEYVLKLFTNELEYRKLRRRTTLLNTAGFPRRYNVDEFRTDEIDFPNDISLHSLLELDFYQAVVNVYTSDGLVQSFYVPVNTEAVIWEVFEISNGVVIPAQRYYSNVEDKPWWQIQNKDEGDSYSMEGDGEDYSEESVQDEADYVTGNDEYFAEVCGDLSTLMDLFDCGCDAWDEEFGYCGYSDSTEERWEASYGPRLFGYEYGELNVVGEQGPDGNCDYLGWYTESEEDDLMFCDSFAVICAAIEDMYDVESEFEDEVARYVLSSGITISVYLGSEDIAVQIERQ